MSRFLNRSMPALRPILAALAIALVSGLQPVSPASAASLGDGSHPLARVSSGSTGKIDHSAFDALLKTYVAAGADGINRVHFVKFREGGLVALKSYLLGLQRQDPTHLGAAEHAAYFINLYNALTLDVVLEHYPVNSIKMLRFADASGTPQEGPWRVRLGAVNKQAVSLDEIAGAILRPTLMKRDPRGHYLLNCLSIGCPNLLPEAITGEKLAAQMTAAAEAFVRHPRGLTVSDGRVKASSLYSWYADDFGGPAGVISHIKAAGGPDIAAKLAGISAITDHDYDWALADASR